MMISVEGFNGAMLGLGLGYPKTFTFADHDVWVRIMIHNGHGVNLV